MLRDTLTLTLNPEHSTVFNQVGDYTDEYRIGFRHEVVNAEDAKSEVVKLFQEAYERENGFFFTDTLPPVTKYAEDILRDAKKKEQNK